MHEILIKIHNAMRNDNPLTVSILVGIINTLKKSKLEVLQDDDVIELFYSICGDIEDCFELYDYINLLFIIISPVRELHFSTPELMLLVEDVVYREKSILKYTIYKELVGLETAWDTNICSLNEYHIHPDIIEQKLSIEKIYELRDQHKQILKLEQQLLSLR